MCAVVVPFSPVFVENQVGVSVLRFGWTLALNFCQTLNSMFSVQNDVFIGSLRKKIMFHKSTLLQIINSTVN